MRLRYFLLIIMAETLLHSSYEKQIVKSSVDLKFLTHVIMVFDGKVSFCPFIFYAET
jgi:hypothetical protein